MTGLRERVRSVLATPTARWYPGLADELAAVGWADLAGLGIAPETYGVARVLRADPAAPRNAEPMIDAGFGRSLWLERYDETMRLRYGGLGLQEPAEPPAAAGLAAEVARAMALIAAAPAAADAVRTLVWSITPVAVEGPAYDTSYSDPAVPFSIFIGAHRPGDRVPAIRLAEGILHEAMHLQLSLIEDVLPLISGCADQRRSPWQGRLRPTQGLLHGLYVFRVIQDWLRVATGAGAIAASDRPHAHRRIEQIDVECAELAGLAGSDDLTSHGRVLAETLLS